MAVKTCQTYLDCADSVAHHRTGFLPVMFGFTAMAIKFSLCLGWSGEKCSRSAYTFCHHLHWFLSTIVLTITLKKSKQKAHLYGSVPYFYLYDRPVSSNHRRIHNNIYYLAKKTPTAHWAKQWICSFLCMSMHLCTKCNKCNLNQQNTTFEFM